MVFPQELPREFIEDFRRARAAVAIAELAHEHGGAAHLTATEIVGRARMSRKTFYELFGGKASGLEFACRFAYERIFAPVTAVNEGAGPWLDRLASALGHLFAAVVEEPLLAELCLVHSLATAETGSSCTYRAAVEATTAAVRDGRQAGQAALGSRYRDPPSEAEEFVASAIVSVTALRIRQGTAHELASHRDELVRLAATPFLGPEEAATRA
jgi:AcrR family transcriptional regulator